MISLLFLTNNIFDISLLFCFLAYAKRSIYIQETEFHQVTGNNQFYNCFQLLDGIKKALVISSMLFDTKNKEFIMHMIKKILFAFYIAGHITVFSAPSHDYNINRDAFTNSTPNDSYYLICQDEVDFTDKIITLLSIKV